ncbi:metallophosphoesterase family protein [Ramlibacter humi]|uniref:Metallophosphoesterase n=1 Tax=Ramlibacter humi TaxID=2530451 RepID=A0A4Z0BNR2_9BURK|nr:metallophosphoesterase [Ramlibacter humi]TFZ00064.1 metallophosphoesterase [Ramlibacter humi]
MDLVRRQLLRSACGGLVYASALFPASRALARGAAGDFNFVQLSDLHWGYPGPENPDARGTLPKAIAEVNALDPAPDFIVFTGDLTHTTDDPVERRKRLREVQAMTKDLKVKDLRFMPGEHDASLDKGRAFGEFFGPAHYAFDHEGVHFVTLDNVSDPAARLGEAQLGWLADDLHAQPAGTPIVVFTHRPLFDLYPQWDWATRDGQQAIDLLATRPDVVVFYGHIHQEHHRMTGAIAHHSAKSLMFALPAPASQPKRTPLPWDPAQPYKGLGWREIEALPAQARYAITEVPVQKGAGT